MLLHTKNTYPDKLSIPAAVVLAAGASSRMGQPKALLDLNGKSFIDTILSNLDAVGCNPTIPVLGKAVGLILEQSKAKDYPYIQNLNPEQGMLSSLKMGLQKIPESCAGLLMCLVDHPLVEIVTYQRLLQAAFENPGKIIIPQIKKQHGHPVYINRKYFPEIQTAPDGIGLDTIFHRYPDQIIYLDVEDTGILADIDTPKDFRNFIR